MNPRIELVPVSEVHSTHPLGRHINWDPRSKAHRVERVTTCAKTKFYNATNKNALKQRYGSCCGHSLAQCLNSEPFNLRLDNDDAERIYHEASLIDPFEGSWPPDDTGSDGLSVMRVAKKFGQISSYSHCFNLDDVIQGLQSGPGIAGINWFEGFDEPNENGLVLPTGRIRGGHEITIQGCDIEECLIWFRTSYGPDFGVTHKGLTGCFCMDFPTTQSVLFTDGDAVFPRKM